MGKYVDISYTNLADTILSTKKDLLKNPYYHFTGQNMTPVIYYKFNKEKSTLDEGISDAYSPIGKDSPFRYDTINGLLLGGLDNININLDNTEHGIQASDITGDGFVLPDTIQPIPGEFFSVLHLDKPYLFKITSVNSDTLYDGANFFTFQYELRYENDKDIKPLIINHYQYITNMVGNTRYNSIISTDEYNIVIQLEEVNKRLRDYYIDLFYDEAIEAFVHKYDDIKRRCLYDPYLNEFMIRNKVFDYGKEKYFYVGNKPGAPVKPSKYKNTWFQLIEDRSLELNSKLLTGYGHLNEYAFSHYIYDVYVMEYERHQSGVVVPPFTIFTQDIIDGIVNNDTSKVITEEHLDNIILIHYIINYLNGVEMDSLDLKNLLDFNFKDDIYTFYFLPIIIYWIDKCIKNHISRRK